MHLCGLQQKLCNGALGGGVGYRAGGGRNREGDGKVESQFQVMHSIPTSTSGSRTMKHANTCGRLGGHNNTRVEVRSHANSWARLEAIPTHGEGRGHANTYEVRSHINSWGRLGTTPTPLVS
jgi:hypothetical protein